MFRIPAAALPRRRDGQQRADAVLQRPAGAGSGAGGQLKPIAIAADKRSPLLPDVPTFAEGGVDYKFGTWFGLLAPAKTPSRIIATLNRNTVDTLQEPAVRARIAEQGAEVVANSPTEFRAFIKAEMDRLGGVIRMSKMQLD